MYKAVCLRALPFLMLILLVSSATAQSSSRSLPSVLPTIQRPQGYAVPQGQVQFGSSTRPGTVIQGTMPAQGSATRGGTVIQQGVPAQGSATRQGSTLWQPATVVQSAPVQTFEQKLWGYLLRAKYRNWAPVPGKSDGMYPGESPHGAFLKMYLNRRAAGSASTLPTGSMVIKENYKPDKTLAAITVMYKNKGYNPAGGDWYWVKYNPNGTVAEKPTPKGSMRLAGKVGGCIECHGDAGGGDFAFFND